MEYSFFGKEFTCKVWTNYCNLAFNESLIIANCIIENNLRKHFKFSNSFQRNKILSEKLKIPVKGFIINFKSLDDLEKFVNFCQNLEQMKRASIKSSKIKY